LVYQLEVYKLYKHAANWLEAREFSHLRSYLHLPAQPQIVTKLDQDELSLSELVSAARQILFPQPEHFLISEIVTLSGISIREKIREIIHYLDTKSQTTFNVLLSENRSRLEAILIFLAILELIKRTVVEVEQAGLFSEINIKRLENVNRIEDLDLEFDE
jgi:segregation and condensation protein A